MSLSVKLVKDVTDAEYVAGFVSEEGGRGRIFLAKSSAYNYPKANGVPVQVVAPVPEDIVDEANTPPMDGKGPFYLNLTYDPASPESGSNGRFLVTDGTYVIIASTGTG